MIFVCDPAGGEVPEWKRDVVILSTPSCISIRCYPEQDGPTEVILGRTDEVDPGHPPDFDHVLATPNRAVVVFTVGNEEVLESAVPERETRIRIWLSHPRWPEKVIIGCG